MTAINRGAVHTNLAIAGVGAQLAIQSTRAAYRDFAVGSINIAHATPITFQVHLNFAVGAAHIEILSSTAQVDVAVRGFDPHLAIAVGIDIAIAGMDQHRVKARIHIDVAVAGIYIHFPRRRHRKLLQATARVAGAAIRTRKIQIERAAGLAEVPVHLAKALGGLFLGVAGGVGGGQTADFQAAVGRHERNTAVEAFDANIGDAVAGGMLDRALAAGFLITKESDRAGAKQKQGEKCGGQFELHCA